MNTTHKELAVATVVFATVVAVVYWIGPKDFMTGDTIHYLAMTHGEAVPAPFAFRLLTPALVAMLPGTPGQGFFVVAYLSTLATLLTMYLTFRHLEISRETATVAGILLGLSYPLANYLARWGRIDPLANFLFALALLLILRRQFLSASLIMTFGVLGKETLVLLLPILFLHRMQDRMSLRNLINTAALCALPLISFLTVRAIIVEEEGAYTLESPSDIGRVMDEVWAYNVDQFGLPKRIARDVTKSYGFLWTLAALGLITAGTLRLESLYLIAIGFALCFIATDWARMLGTGFPGIFIPVACFLERLHSLPGWRLWAAVFVALSLGHCYLSLLIYRDLEPSGRLAMVAGDLMIVLAGSALALWGFIHQRRRSEAT